jgi:pimeloyl-ACP methyl ester carboxylesterase
VHLAGLSSGGRLVTMAALAHPDLVRSLTLAEPAMAELLADLPEAKAVQEELRQALELIRTTANAGEAVQAATFFLEWGNNQGAGAFDRQPEAFRQMILDNARTVRLQLSAPRPPGISRATQGHLVFQFNPDESQRL